MQKMLLTVAAMGMALAAAGAQAATVVTFDSYQDALNPGETLVTDFDGATMSVAAGYGFGGDGSLLTGTSTAGAAPAFGPTAFDPTQYLSVQGGQVFTLSTPELRQISFYFGSLDSYNSISFTGVGGFSQSFSGLDLNAATAAADLANGDRTSAGANGRYTFNFDQAITGVRLDAGQNSLEVSNIGALAAAIPEPSSWALMILGFGGIGALLRRRGGALRPSQSAAA